jgi:hypothetical protein
MKNRWKYWSVLFLAVGCAPNASIPPDKALSIGSPEEKNAVAIVKRLAVQHKYYPEKMNMEIKSNPETGDFMIFLFPKPVDAQHLRREHGLFAIVNSKSGQVIRFSDPALGPEK